MNREPRFRSSGLKNLTAERNKMRGRSKIPQIKIIENSGSISGLTNPQQIKIDNDSSMGQFSEADMARSALLKDDVQRKSFEPRSSDKKFKFKKDFSSPGKILSQTIEEDLTSEQQFNIVPEVKQITQLSDSSPIKSTYKLSAEKRLTRDDRKKNAKIRDTQRVKRFANRGERISAHQT